MTEQLPSNGGLIWTDETKRLVKRGATRFSQLINDPNANFPRPVLVGNQLAFVLAEVLEWIAKQPRVPLEETKAARPAKLEPPFFAIAAERRRAAKGKAKSEPEQSTAGTPERPA